jgi:hypothetical protein
LATLAAGYDTVKESPSNIVIATENLSVEPATLLLPAPNAAFSTSPITFTFYPPSTYNQL